MVACLQELGFMVGVTRDPAERSNRTLTVYGQGGVIRPGGTEDQPLDLFVGNAGTAARFLAAMVCLGSGVYRLHGVDRMHERPQAALFLALRELGYRVDAPGDKLPARIHGGGRREASCRVSIDSSSQFASALLLCACAGGWQVSVTGENAEESPYVAMTAKLLASFPAGGGTVAIEPDASSGSYFGLKSQCPGAFRDVARMLAKLHQMKPAELGFSLGGGPQESLINLIGRYEKKWRDNATKPSPLIDYAYSWARRECARDPGTVSVVHGDAGPYNMLVADDRLTALLDWEFAHVGDPAEDLGIARVYAEDVMSWDEFLEIYAEAGGRPVPERRVRLAMVLQFLKGTTLVATSGRNFEEGWTREFIKGANSFTGLRLIELKIAGLLQRFEGV
jgi:hypothetical protein